MEVVEIGGEYRLACSNGHVLVGGYEDRERAEWIASRVRFDLRRLAAK
jgi:hypothetical protein